MLILAPVVCVLSAIGCSYIIAHTVAHIRTWITPVYTNTTLYTMNTKPVHICSSLCILIFTIIALLLFGWHCTYVTAIAYSSPNIIIDAGVY